MSQFAPWGTFARRRRAHADGVVGFLAGLQPLALLDGMFGNVGDHLIWAGTRDLLAMGDLAWQPVAVGDIAGADGSGRTLVVPGNSALHRFWHEWLPATLLEASRRYRRVVILASTIEPAVPVVEALLSQANVYAFTRDRRSYEAIKPFGRAVLAFDPALYAGIFDQPRSDAPWDAPDARRGGDVLVALREDQGSPLGPLGLRPNPDVNRDLSLTATDLGELLDGVRAAGAVITDRLHVAVPAILLGTPVTYLDPYDAKISGYLEFVFGGTEGGHVRRCDVEYLRERDLVVADGVA